MTIAYRIIILIILAILAGPLFALTMNLLIAMSIFPDAATTDSIGAVITQKAIFVWLSSLVLGIISLFIQEKWRAIFLFAPLLAPSLFAIFYSLSL